MNDFTRHEHENQYIRIAIETDTGRFDLAGRLDRLVSTIFDSRDPTSAVSHDWKTYGHEGDYTLHDPDTASLAFVWGEVMDHGPQIIIHLTESVTDEKATELLEHTRETIDSLPNERSRGYEEIEITTIEEINR